MSASWAEHNTGIEMVTFQNDYIFRRAYYYLSLNSVLLGSKHTRRLWSLEVSGVFIPHDCPSVDVAVALLGLQKICMKKSCENEHLKSNCYSCSCSFCCSGHFRILCQPPRLPSLAVAHFTSSRPDWTLRTLAIHFLLASVRLWGVHTYQCSRGCFFLPLICHSVSVIITPIRAQQGKQWTAWMIYRCPFQSAKTTCYFTARGYTHLYIRTL